MPEPGESFLSLARLLELNRPQSASSNYRQRQGKVIGVLALIKTAFVNMPLRAFPPARRQALRGFSRLLKPADGLTKGTTEKTVSFDILGTILVLFVQKSAPRHFAALGLHQAPGDSKWIFLTN